MPLHPYLTARLSVFDQLHPESPWEDVARARAEFELDPEPWAGPTVDIRDDSIAGPHGPVPIRIYAEAQRSAGVLLWIHGGAFIAGDLEMPESHLVAAELARRAGIAVVTVDYRLAVGGVHYPVPQDDVEAAWLWIQESFAPDAPYAAIGGASAGATLATGLAIHRRAVLSARPDALLLAYPFLHHPLPTLEAALAADFDAELHPALRIDTAFQEFAVSNYVGRSTDIPAEAAPGNTELEGLPPTWIAVAEYDDLRPSGEEFERQLVSAGVPVQALLATGMPHGYLNRTLFLEEVPRTLEFFTDALAELAAASSPAAQVRV